MRILRINSICAHFLFINKTASKTACQLRLSLNAEQLIIPTIISPIEIPSKQHWRFEQVLEHFIIFTELVNTFQRFAPFAVSLEFRFNKHWKDSPKLLTIITKARYFSRDSVPLTYAINDQTQKKDNKSCFEEVNLNIQRLSTISA